MDIVRASCELNAAGALPSLPAAGAELTEQPAPSGFGDQQMIAATLVNHALLVNAAYLVMGAYSRSRISEYVFGGVTRTLLKQCPLSLVLAH